MSRLDKINELIDKLQAEPTTAYKRLEKLFDENSFVELGAYNKNAGVVTGYGTVNGKLVYAFAQEGAVSTDHARKIDDVYSLALKMGCPVVAVMDSNGMKIDDGLDTLEAYGIMFKNQTAASGVIPQISVVLGNCLGISSFLSILSDFVIMSETGAKMFMSSPSIYSGLEGKATTYEALGGAKTLAENGVVHFSCPDEEECFNKARKLIDMLPSNNLDDFYQIEPTDDLNREDATLNTVIPEDNVSPVDMEYIVKSIADNGDFFEICESFAKGIRTGFVRLDGITAGVVANNGQLSADSAKKAGEFVNICDAFNIPIVTFTDIDGYVHNDTNEHSNTIKYGAKFMFAFANATVPKINVIVRNGIGNAYLLMNSKHIGADIVYAWPSACVALMSREAAINIMGTSSERYDQVTSPYEVAAKGYIDGVIIPSTTRKRILMALEMLMTKRENTVLRKHSSIEF